MFKHLSELAKESLIYGIAGVATRAILFALVPLYTRLFSPEEYGLLGLVLSTITLVQIFVILALDAASYRFFYETDDIEDQKRTIGSWFWCQIFLTALLGIIIISASNTISIWLTGESKGANLFVLATLNLVPLTFVNLATNWFRFQRLPIATGLLSIVTMGLTVLFSLLFLLVMHAGLTGVFLAQLSANTIGSIIVIFYMKSWLSIRHLDLTRLHDMLLYSAPLIPGAIATWIVNYSSRFYLQFFESAQEVGLFQFGANLALAVGFVTIAFQQAWGPFGLSVYKKAEAKNIYAEVLNGYTVITCLLALALSIFASEIISLVATDEYIDSRVVVSVLAFSYIMTGLGSIANIGPSIVKSMKPFGQSVFLAAIANIILSLILVPIFGLGGAAAATLLSQMIIPVYVFYHSQKMYQIPYRFRSVIGMIAGSLAMAVLFNVLNTQNSIATAVIKTILFPLLSVGLVFLTKALTRAQAIHIWQQVVYFATKSTAKPSR